MMNNWLDEKIEFKCIDIFKLIYGDKMIKISYRDLFQILNKENKRFNPNSKTNEEKSFLAIMDIYKKNNSTFPYNSVYNE